jgi:hypothetical protein
MTKIVLIGEAWGEQEANYEHPFVGPAGAELYRMLKHAGFPGEPLDYRFSSPVTMLSRWRQLGIPLLNVFNERPKDNIKFFYGKTSDEKSIPLDKSLPSRKFGSSVLWTRKDKAHHVQALHARLEELKPNLIIPLGATACWALNLGAGITSLRGSLIQTPWGKVLPTYHPAAVLRKWDLRPTTVIDFHKARREMEYPELRLTNREIWTVPSISDLWLWWEQHGSKSKLLAFDIETLRQQQISEVGFAASATNAIHIPFCWQEGRVYKSYWSSVKEEAQAIKFCAHVLNSDIPKIAQNGVQYDCYWLAKEWGVAVRNFTHDTMTLAHCWQPELPKSLEFLGSVFLDERSWKQIRKHTGKED